MKRPDGRHWAGPPHSPLLSVTSSRNPFAVIARSVLADQLIPDGALVLLAILASLHRGKRPLTLSAKELAVSQGVMLSTHYDRRHRGIEAPRLLMADGNAAIWGAVRQVWPEAGEQRCWNHKMRNVLDRLPQREQSEAKDLLRAVVYAPSRAALLLVAEKRFRRLDAPHLLKGVFEGRKFEDGKPVSTQQRKNAA